MKKILFILSLIVLGFSSCKKECDQFHEGKKCETEIRTKYFGSYAGIGVSNGVSNNVTEEISTHPDGAQFIYLNNEVKCEMISSTNFKINLQSFMLGGQTTFIEGGGSFSGSQMIYTATLTRGSTSWNIAFTGSK